MAEGDREQVGPVGRVEHVDVRLDHDIARDREPDHRCRQDLANVAVAKQLSHELDGWGLAGLQPNDRPNVLLGGERGHRSRVVEVAAKRPFAIDGLTGRKRRGDELSMVRHLDRDSDHVNVGLGHQLFVVRKHRINSERQAGSARGFRAGCAECPDLVVR